MAYRNVSRVPVIEKGSITGVVGTLELVDIMLRREPMRGGGLLKEKGTKEMISIDRTPVTSVMKTATPIDKLTFVKDAAELLSAEEEVFIEDGGRFYVLTHKDVVELITKERKTKERKGIYVQISNLGEIDAFTNAKIEKKIAEFVQKIGRMMDLQSFVIHVERHEKQGKKIKYSIRTRFLTPIGLFVSRSWGWNLATVFQDAIDNLEREILKKHEKIARHERGKRLKMLRQ
jgi:ribosome-associated translation inhibitor RaiA